MHTGVRILMANCHDRCFVKGHDYFVTCIYKAFFTLVSHSMASFLLHFRFLFCFTYYVKYECLGAFKGIELFIKLILELHRMLAQSSIKQ